MSPDADLLLVKAPPLQRLTISLQVRCEGGAAVGDGQIRQVVLEDDGVSVLVEERADDGHQLGEGLGLAAVGVVHATSWPQGGAQLP